MKRLNYIKSLQIYDQTDIHCCEIYDYWNLKSEPMKISFHKKNKSFIMSDGQLFIPYDEAKHFEEIVQVKSLQELKKYVKKHILKIPKSKIENELRYIQTVLIP